MSSGAKQLSEDFEQVQKLLKSYPNIKIINTEGDPPEQYDIEYSIKGYRTEPDGSASPENKHQVRITLPFGYPHFPPTAKPLTPIFHPDIDPDAIRIADFWQHNNSLPELIIHIGQMICGNHYTTEEPFNQSASDWFEERSSWLPFDILESRDEEELAELESQETTNAEKADESFVPDSDAELDILKEDLDFPFDEEEFASDISTDEPEAEAQEGEEADEIDFGIDLGIEDEPVSFDIEEEIKEEAVDQKAEETEEEDTIDFDLGSEDFEDAIDFDLGATEEEPVIAPADGGDDLFNLEAEETDATAEEEAAVPVDSEDFPAAFAEEDESAESTDVDITLDDLGDLEEETDELDFGIAEDTMAEGDSGVVDLSGLESFAEEMEPAGKETADETADGTANAEEDVLSSLSLDMDFTAEDKAEEQDVAIRNLIEQKQIFTAKKILAEHPNPDSLPSKKEFDLTINDAISEAEDLFKNADKHEKNEDYEKAGIMLDLVANIAVDFPGLDMARNKIREAIMGGGKKKPAKEGEEQEEEWDTFIGQEKESDEEKPTKKKKKSRAKFGFSFKIPAKALIGIVIVVVLGGIGGGAAFVYMGDDQKVQEVRAIVQEAEQLISSKEFTKAKQKFATATTALDEVLFFQSGEKERILKQIASIQNSSNFREGLKGRVLYGDMYVTIEVAKAIDKFNTQAAYAKKVLQDGKLDQAIAAYEKALPYAEQAGFDNETRKITHTVNELRVKSALEKGTQAEEKLDWVKAKEGYAKALEYSKTISTPEVQQDIAKKMAEATYHYGLQVGLKAMNESQWQTAVNAFQEVKTVFAANPKAPTKAEKIEVDKLLIQSQLYLYLAEAKQAFEEKVWNRAISIYNDAIALLKENLSVLGEEGERNITMIEKTILTTRIAEKQGDVALVNSKDELEKAAELYKAIVTLIEESSFKNDATLASILIDAKTKTEEIKEQILVRKKEQWLTDNYKEIFLENYPTSKSSEFLNPKVRFIKREGEMMIFNLSCTELKQGRKFRLEVNYQNDLKTGEWSLFTGKIDEEKEE